jgi:hypothetical protein
MFFHNRSDHPKRTAYDSPVAAARATTAAHPPPQKNNANLEPVLQDGLRPFRPSATVKKTLAASRGFSPAVIRELREIFSVPRFEEIFDGHFRRDSDFVESTRNPRCRFFRDASLFRPFESNSAGTGVPPWKYSRAGFSCRTGFATTIDCRKGGWPWLLTSSWE